VRIRALQSKSLLAAVRTLAPASRDRILVEAGSALTADVDAALAISWLDMDKHMRLSDVVRDVIGPAENVAVWRSAMTRTFRHPLLEGFSRLATRLFGASPLSLLRHTGRIYAHLTMDLGEAGFEPGPTPETSRVWLRGFPAHRYRFICYEEGVMGCIESAFDVCRAAGRVTVESRDAASGSVSYQVRSSGAAQWVAST